MPTQLLTPKQETFNLYKAFVKAKQFIGYMECVLASKTITHVARHRLGLTKKRGEGRRQSMQEVETDKIIVDHSTIYEVFDSKFNYTLLDRLVNSCRMIGEPCYKIRGVERQSFHFKCGDFTIVLMPMMSQDADYHITL